MIPKILHQIWFNGSPPEPFIYFSQHLRELHPNWEYKLWTLDNMPELANQEAFNWFEKPMFKSDILRYEVLYSFGGVYVDFDFLCLKNIEPLLQKDYLVVYDADNFHINNCLLGFTPNNQRLKFCIDAIPCMLKRAKKSNGPSFYIGLNTVGPRMLQRKLVQHDPSIVFLDRKLTHPVDSDEIESKQLNEFYGSYGVHFWNNRKGHEFIVAHKKLPCYIRQNQA